MKKGQEIQEIPIDRIRRGQFQPREQFDQDELEQLAKSMEETNGMIQPVVVRPIKSPDADYELLAGERRWRAAQLNLWQHVPGIVRHGVTDAMACKISIIENIQRKELNPIEEARGLHRLFDEFKLSHGEIGEDIGRSRTYVTNMIRLLKLDPIVQDYLQQGILDAGHGKAIASFNAIEQQMLAREAIERRYTVDQLEKRVQMWSNKNGKKEKKSEDPDIERLKRGLSTYLGTRVDLKLNTSGSGICQIHFYTLEELQGQLERMGYDAEEGADEERYNEKEAYS
jgi:ParB family chromosome partitioning protein